MHEQRQREKAVRDRAAEQRLRALEVDVHELVIERHVCELIDPVLVDEEPIGNAEPFADSGRELLTRDGFDHAATFRCLQRRCSLATGVALRSRPFLRRLWSLPPLRATLACRGQTRATRRGREALPRFENDRTPTAKYLLLFASPRGYCQRLQEKIGSCHARDQTGLFHRGSDRCRVGSLAGGTERAAYSLEAYVSSEAIQAQYIRETSVSDIGKADVAVGVFFNEDEGFDRPGDRSCGDWAARHLTRFSLRVGTRLYAAFLNGEDEDVFGVSVGGDARYLLGKERGNSIVLNIFYAPDILVFGSADSVRDASVRFETGLQGNTTIFVGYRTLEFELAATRRVEDSVHIGARHTF